MEKCVVKHYGNMGKWPREVLHGEWRGRTRIVATFNLSI